MHKKIIRYILNIRMEGGIDMENLTFKQACYMLWGLEIFNGISISSACEEVQRDTQKRIELYTEEYSAIKEQINKRFSLNITDCDLYLILGTLWEIFRLHAYTSLSEECSLEEFFNHKFELRYSTFQEIYKNALQENFWRGRVNRGWDIDKYSLFSFNAKPGKNQKVSIYSLDFLKAFLEICNNVFDEKIMKG